MPTITALKKAFTLYPHQETAVDILHDAIHKGVHGYQIIMGTGFGKTYVAAAFIKKLQDEGFFDDCIAPMPVMYVTAKSVVEQSRRVMRDAGVKRVMVINYDSLRASMGGLFLTWKTEVVHGEPILKPHWDPDFAPKLIIWDENQQMKNEGSLRHLVGLSYVNQCQNGYSVFFSATPYGRVCETKVFALSTRLKVPFGYTEQPLNEKIWPSFSRDIAYPKDPSDNSPAAMKRFAERFDNFIHRAKGVRFKKKTHISCKLIDFETPEQIQAYQIAYAEYLQELAEAGRHGPQGIAAIWVAQLKFRMKAELLRVKRMAREAIQMHKDGYAPVISSNFIDTINGVYGELLKAGITADKISIIIGGQTTEERQKNIDAFQSGKAEFCLFTMRSGGVGLSLHHEIEGLRPRCVILPPTWSAIELVQALGRAHRINSLSDTPQVILWYSGTVEEEVAAKVQIKLKCLGEIVGKQETWSNAFNKRAALDCDTLISSKMIAEVSEVNEDGEIINVSSEEVEAMTPEDTDIIEVLHTNESENE